MENVRQKYHLEDSNPIDIINRNAQKLDALKMLLTDDGISVQRAEIVSGLYFLFTYIIDQIKYASQRIEDTNAALRFAAMK
jgi:hypothetical protein